MLGLLFPIFGKYAADNIKSALERTKFQALCAALIGGALLMAVIFICLTLFFFLAEFMSPVRAAAVLALIWLVIAFAGIIAICVSTERRKRERRARSLMSAENTKLFTGAALSLVPSLLKSAGGKSWRHWAVLAAAAASGVAAYRLLHKQGEEQGTDNDA